MMLANMGLPMIAVVWPASWFLFIPIVLIEWLVGRKLLGVPSSAAFGATLGGNLASTLLAIPLAWGVMLLIGISTRHVYPGDFLGVVNEVLLHSAWLAPWSPRQDWLVPAAALFLCVPFYFASVGTEYLVAKWTLKTRYPEARITSWAWRANGLTYSLIVIALSAETLRQAQA